MSSLVSDYLCLLSFPCKAATEYTGRVTVCMYVCFCACTSVRSSAKKFTVFQYISVCVDRLGMGKGIFKFIFRRKCKFKSKIKVVLGRIPSVAKSF